MDDRDVVAAIVAGDPAGLAEAYDRYAVPLYAYCRSLLSEPADAADAVHDTYLIAMAKLCSLRDPAKLRPWLYAVARNECVRRLRAANVTAALDEAQDLPAAAAIPGIEAERADLHALVRDAIDGLNPGERDVIELSLGHELAGDDLADALGVSRNHAHALLSRARGQLERSLGALIVARTGREACDQLSTLLAGWNGRLTVLLRKRISRHIEGCEICRERKRHELPPTLFAGLVPLAALTPGFREQLLTVISDQTPAGLTHRMGVANSARPFGPSGFPRPLTPPGARSWHHAIRPPRAMLHHSRAVVAGTASTAVAAVIVVIAVVTSGGPPPAPSAAGPARGSGPGLAISGHDPSPAPGRPSARSGPPSNGGSALAPSALRSGAAGAPGTPPLGTPPLGTLPLGTPPLGTAAPGTARSGTAAPSAASSPPATTKAAGSPAAPAPAVSPGTLIVSPATVDLAAVNGTATGHLTITARGGPVSHYSVAGGPALAGQLTVSPSSGSLAAGASVTITVTSASLVALDGTLTVNPGGQMVTVVLGVGL